MVEAVPRYELRIRGRLDPATAERFAPLTAIREPACTVLRGPIRDQAELHGTLALVRSLGLELIELRRIDRSMFLPPGSG